MKTLYSIVKNNLIVTGRFIGVKESISDSGNKIISLSRKIASKSITINLEFINDDIYIRPPNYIFKSSSSHCDYIVDENRWTRQKNVIFGLVEDLQKASIWPFIKNKHFFVINENCASFKKKKGLKSAVADQISEVLTNDTKKISRKEMRDLDKQATDLLK